MKLINIQAELKAPKNQTNSFGKYKYRSAEDIIEAVKPILFKYQTALLISDEIVQVADRVYVKATAMLIDENNEELPVKVYGWAREEEIKKGMDAAQITGSASSYARKYALNGLFAIDDTKDSDATNEHKDEVGEEKRMKLITLLENTIWDETLKSKQAIKISAYTTNEQYDKALKIILANQNK
jgi:ERF superfamily